MNWNAVTLSLQVTVVSTVCLFIVGLALAYLLARRRVPGQIVLETLINLPLVLPPSVIGYYLLLAMGRGSPLFDWLDIRIIFTWKAAVVASTIVGLPLMFQTARAAIAGVDPALEQAARTLGSSELEILWRVTLPLARRGLIAGLILGSARALGEFGATLMVAGNIPDQTQTLPLAIYDAVQSRQYDLAGQMVLTMTLLGFAGLWWARRLELSPGRHRARATANS